MRALRCNRYGPPQSLVVEDLPNPRPGPGEVLIGVEAAAVNFPDVLIAAGLYQVRIDVPFTPGSEFAGRVLAVGSGVSRFVPGDPVRGSCTVGAFSEMVVANEAAIRAIPEGTSFTLAAAFHVVYATAYHALRSVGQAKPGEWVVVLGAAGGVGLAAVELAAAMGCRVLAAASSPGKLAACEAKGADAVVNYSHEDLKVRIKDLTGGGADVFVDPVGGSYSEAALRAGRWGSRFVVVGFASGEIPRIPLNLVLIKGVEIRGFELRTFAQFEPTLAARDDEELAALWESHKVVPYVASKYPLDRADEALAEVAQRRSIGKVVIEMASRS